MRDLGLQLLPQVYGLLYARPPSTICVSRATVDRLQAQAQHIMHRNHFSAGNEISLQYRPSLFWPKLDDLDWEALKEASHFVYLPCVMVDVRNVNMYVSPIFSLS